MDDRSRRTGYSLSRLNRAAERRTDATWLAVALATARFLVFSGDRAIFPLLGSQPGDPVFSAEQAAAMSADMERAVFLGIDGETALFAVPVPEPGDDGFVAIDLRSLAVQGLAAPEWLGPIAQGKSLLDWHARHGFCAVCGTATTMADGGYRRSCPSCGANHFPRTDPVVIMLVTDGEDCLLARSPRFQPGMYSALAGFVEPGETIEDAVRREVGEEAGIAVGRVVYHSSQPWPFPSSLMIGCLARADGRDIVIDREEIEAGRWFNRTEAGEMLGGRHPDGLIAPPSIAIAHQLIKSWVVGEMTP